jgi:hypothetical protein
MLCDTIINVKTNTYHSHLGGKPGVKLECAPICKSACIQSIKLICNHVNELRAHNVCMLICKLAHTPILHLVCPLNDYDKCLFSHLL